MCSFYQINALYPDDATRDEQALSRRTQVARCLRGARSQERSASRLPTSITRALASKRCSRRNKAGSSPKRPPESPGWNTWHGSGSRIRDFLTAADWCLRSLEERPRDQSPLYEVLLPYGALAAARMNAELGRNYDVAKLVNDCFDPHGRPQARPGWGVISDRWNGLDAHGLVGSTTDGEGYAFAMNTFQWAGALVPLARYDTRYAHDIGKWTLNLANAARLFYPNALDAEHQSSYAWSSSP